MKLTNCRFLKLLNINAIVLYPVVLYADKYPSPDVAIHEQVHLDQIKRIGAFKFYTQYLYEYLDGRRIGLNHYQAYRNISFEREAYGEKPEKLQTS